MEATVLETQKPGNERHIYALDGIRAIALIMVIWFHIWEQSWLTPYTHLNPVITRYFGITELHFHTLVQFGYTTVDMLILLSAVVNFLPYARAIVYGEEWPDQKTFYIKRAIRILPSYLLCIVIMAIGSLIGGKYQGNVGFFFKDLITHLTFTSTFFKDTYRTTKLNGALWTIQVEVIWYILIPFIAKWFRKRPVITTAALYLIGIVSGNILVCHAQDLWAYNNYFSTFAGFYASGMLICLIYYGIRKADAENRYTMIAATTAIFGSYLIYLNILNQFYGMERPYAQLTKRFSFMLAMSLFTLGVLFAFPVVKRFFENRVFRFVSVISYNLYIWHQVVAVFLKEHHIPRWSTDTAPNELGDQAWMRKFFVLSIVLGVALSAAVTYLFEKPAGEYLKKKWLDENGKAKPPKHERKFKWNLKGKTVR
ncbi:MAG: acyltransferase [Lachnospiraceae bacterium]|nr:acyltransferase [Lachnospiraceae bacterium]